MPRGRPWRGREAGVRLLDAKLTGSYCGNVSAKWLPKCRRHWTNWWPGDWLLSGPAQMGASGTGLVDAGVGSWRSWSAKLSAAVNQGRRCKGTRQVREESGH